MIEARNDKIKREIESILDRHLQSAEMLRQSEDRLNEEKQRLNRELLLKHPELSFQ